MMQMVEPVKFKIKAFKESYFIRKPRLIKLNKIIHDK